MDINLSFTWQITRNETQKVDPILFDLLAKIQQLGSLKQASENLRISYRFAWGLLVKWERNLSKPLVIMQRGRGAKLSKAGEKLLLGQQQLLARFSPELDNFTTQFKREFDAILDRKQSSTLSIFASHGLAISTLRDLIEQQSDYKLDLHFHGSLESLRALKQGECNIAGFHIPIGPIAKVLSPQYLELLDPKKYQLIYVVQRHQGLMFRANYSKKIDSISSLVQENCRFINRQTDSGTRLLFDQLLQQQQIEPEQICGYVNEEFTHMAVAAMIASGAADVGFGIAPLADKFKLNFIPIIWEHYCLAVPNTLANNNGTKVITSLLQSEKFKQNLTEFSGYNVSRSGKPVTFKEIFP